MEKTEVTAAVSQYISKFFHRNFGKGPEYVHATVNSCFITVYIRNFITPSERVLMNQNRDARIIEIRDLVINALSYELKANILRITGMEVNEFYYDWSLHNKSAMFTFVCSDQGRKDEALEHQFNGKLELENEIVHLSRIAQKEPDELITYRLNSRTLLLLRHGILVTIEKELIRDGLHENLKIAKRRLEKRLLHNNTHFEEILETRVKDIFVDWDFELDKSVTLFITDPQK